MVYVIIKQDKNGRTIVAVMRVESQAQAVMDVLIKTVGDDKIIFTMEPHKIV